MTTPATDAATDVPTERSTAWLRRTVTTWYGAHARDLPWRRPDASAWGVLVSEVMLQQTPVSRVEPRWREWMARWPEPADLAGAEVADVLRAWDRLGYPRRALRLRAAAQEITAEHRGVVPADEAQLRTLPGVGAYTAAAVAAFAYRRRAVVLDTNVRRVLARAVVGDALPPPSPRQSESQLAAALLPEDGEAAAHWSVAVMELGALVCRARAPQCPQCPIAQRCVWQQAGRPGDEHAGRRRTQAWQGTDRQARGRVMAALREEDRITCEAAARLWPDAAQRDRILTSLEADGLAEAERDSQGTAVAYRLPIGGHG